MNRPTDSSERDSVSKPQSEQLLSQYPLVYTPELMKIHTHKHTNVHMHTHTRTYKQMIGSIMMLSSFPIKFTLKYNASDEVVRGGTRWGIFKKKCLCLSAGFIWISVLTVSNTSAWCLWRPDVRSSRTGAIDFCEPPCWGWKPNSSSARTASAPNSWASLRLPGETSEVTHEIAH